MTTCYNGIVAEITVANIIQLTNQNRKAEGLEILTENSLLTKAAQAKADDMAAKKYFAHTTAEGKRFAEWIDEAGYEYRYAGENLAVNYKEAPDLLAGWMGSVKHRENILGNQFQEIGIGIAVGNYGGNEQAIFVVQEFGSKVGSGSPNEQ